jgi:hypothetical protein
LFLTVLSVKISYGRRDYVSIKAGKGDRQAILNILFSHSETAQTNRVKFRQ